MVGMESELVSKYMPITSGSQVVALPGHPICVSLLLFPSDTLIPVKCLYVAVDMDTLSIKN